MRLAAIVAIIGILALVAVLLVTIKPPAPAEIAGQTISAAQIKTTPLSVYTSAPPSICQASCLDSQTDKLRVLIFNKWMTLEAKRLNVSVPQEQVQSLYNANLDTWRQSRQGERPTLRAAYYAVLATSLSKRIPLDSRSVQNLARGLAREQPQVNATPDTVYRNLDVIKSATEADALRARVALDQGQPLSRVVRRYGLNDQGPLNYKLRNSPSGSLGSRVEQELRASPPGRLVGPIASDGYWWVIDYLSISDYGPDRRQLAAGVFSRASQEFRLSQLPIYLERRYKKETTCRESLFNSFCSDKAS